MLGDHQSSFSGVLSSTGTPDVSESFTAYGNRRNGETWSGAPTTGDETTINSISRQGYTGQTTLGVSMGLNHLNGRIEDTITGRFLSPDPYVPNPVNTQSFNRYSYVNNNPLSLVDPTGFDDEGPLPQLTVTGSNGGSSSPYSASGIGFDFFDYSPFSFKTPYELKVNAAGLAKPAVLRGLPSAAQTSADNGFSYALSADGATRGPQVVGNSNTSSSNSNSGPSALGDINKPSGAAPQSGHQTQGQDSLDEIQVTAQKMASGQPPPSSQGKSPDEISEIDVTAKKQNPLKACSFRQGGCVQPPSDPICLGTFGFVGKDIDAVEFSAFGGAVVDSSVPSIDVGSLSEVGFGGEGIVAGVALTKSAVTGSYGYFYFGGGSISAGPLAGLQVGIIVSGSEAGVYYEHHGALASGGAGYVLSSCVK
jgi:RHS repeat-associated protein